MFKNFWARAGQFSFKDLIASIFVITFLVITTNALAGNTIALEVMKSWIGLIMVVLTGYFGQEAVVAYFDGKNNRYRYDDEPYSDESYNDDPQNNLPMNY